MSNLKVVMRRLFAAAIGAAVAVSACAPAVSREQSEQEIALAMLDYVRPGVEGAASRQLEAGIVIWAEASGADPRAGGPEVVDQDRPIKVWLYSGGVWSEPADMTGAIQDYYDAYVLASGARTWAVHSFAITSLAASGTEAEVMLNSMCGGLCGMGVLHTLRRDTAGGWEFVKEEMIWIS
jgi:hypothetical protein